MVHFKKGVWHAYYLLIVFLFLAVSWMFIHELAHSFACGSFGFEPVIRFTLFGNPETNCEKIADAGYYQKILYILMPYIFDVIVLGLVVFVMMLSNWRIKDSFIRVMPYVIVTDIGLNYFTSPFQVTDFVKLFALIGNSAYGVSIAIAIILVGFVFYAIKDIRAIFPTGRKKEETFEKL